MRGIRGWWWKGALIAISVVLVVGGGVTWYVLEYHTYERANHGDYVPPDAAADFVVFGDLRGGTDWLPISPSFDVVSIFFIKSSDAAWFIFPSIGCSIYKFLKMTP